MANWTVFKMRRDTAANWASKNPVLADGEQGKETDSGKFKLGDGETPWLGLEYFLPESGVLAMIDAAFGGGSGGDGEGGSTAALQALAEHVIDPTPHTAYDEGPSPLSLYKNAKV